MIHDVVIIGDFRFPGGTSVAIAHEIRALSRAGYSVGLVQKRASILGKDRDRFHDLIQAALESGLATLIGPEAGNSVDGISARLAILHNPLVFAEPEAGLPRIDAGTKILVVHQAPTDATGVPNYDAARVNEVAEGIVGEGLVWAPNSPACRDNVLRARLPYPLFEEDWFNLFFVEDWAGDRSQPVGERPVIGRHSRPYWHKWPATRDEMLAAYPGTDEFAVRFLGGDAATLSSIMRGPLPANWTVLPFGEVDPAAFLKTIDFFVYFHHPHLVESFGRTIAEAAASGAVVVLPEHFRPTFGEAALYRRPAEVADTVRAYYADRDLFLEQSRRGQDFVRAHFGPEPYVRRIEALIGKPAATLPATIGAAEPEPDFSFDVLRIGDMRSTAETAWRIANEVRIEHEAGLRVGLMHINTRGPDRLQIVNPMIDELVALSLAEPVDPAAPEIAAGLLACPYEVVRFQS